MITTSLSVGFFVVGIGLAYWFCVRPLLKGRPAFAEFYARTDSFFEAAWLKLLTVKTKLSAILLLVASALVELHDFLLPIATGIDWSPITGAVPGWVWPLVSFGIGALFLWLRNITAATQEKELVAVAAGATIEQAKIEVGTAPVLSEPER